VIDIAQAFQILETAIHTVLKTAQETETKALVKALKGENYMPKERCDGS
jgi:hypothetical protein